MENVIYSCIDRILKGQFEYESGSLSFSVKEIKIAAYPNEEIRGSFHIIAEGCTSVDGNLYSSNGRLSFQTPSFSGGSTEIFYILDTSGMEHGDSIKGDITAISSEGEYRLPFCVEIGKRYPNSSIGIIRNLFHFTNLARADFDEAVKVFYSPEFSLILQGADKRFRSRYRIFSGDFGHAENVEEFLISIRKKSPVSYSCDCGQIDISFPNEAGFFELRVKKSGWGYVKLQVSSDEDFLEPGRDVLQDTDFIGNEARVRIQIKEAALHGGWNFASIILKSSYSELKVPVTIRCGEPDPELKDAVLSRQSLIYGLMEEYVLFRIQRIDAREWSRRSREIAEKLQFLNEKDVEARLYMAQVLISQNRKKEAKYILDHVKNILALGKHPAEYHGYLDYLEALSEGNEEVTRKNSLHVEELYLNNPESMQLLWLYIYIDESLGKNPYRKKGLLSELHDRGNRSPLLYIEALQTMEEEPDTIRKADPYTVMTFYWSIRKGIFKEVFLRPLVYLGYRLQEYNELFTRVLMAYYEKYESEELLTAILMQLIRGEKKGDRYFKWYSYGVSRDFKITKLYESYLHSVPRGYEELLPQSVLLYFGMKSAISDPLMAFLYANIINHREEVPDLLSSYEVQILEFAERAAKSNAIDENYAVIYRYAASIRTLDKTAFMKAVCPLVFFHQIVVEDTDVSYVCAAEDGFLDERRTQVLDGRAYLSFYGGEYELALEDGYGRRRLAEEGIRDRALFQVSQFIHALRDNMMTDLGLAFYLCGSGRKAPSVNVINAPCARFLTDSDNIEKDLQDDFRQCLFSFYYNEEMLQELDSMLESLKLGELSKKSRGEAIRFMVARGMQKAAYDAIVSYGSEGMDPKVLVRLVSRMIREEIQTEDKRLLSVAHRVFTEGKYDETILCYLGAAYQGTTREMRDIWKACMEFDVETEALEERLLVQMMFSGSFVGEKDEIFRHYVEEGGRDRVIDAYLELNSYDCFVKEQITEGFIFDELLRRYRDGEELGMAAALALTRYHGTAFELDREILKELSPLILGFIKKGILFEFFFAYQPYVPVLRLFYDRSFIEYRTNPDKNVLLHSMLLQGDNKDAGYKKEKMPVLFDGVFVRNGVLFLGETLQYYITEEEDGQSNLTYSHSQERDDIVSTDHLSSRFDLLNDILLCYDVQDENSLFDMVDQYIEKTELVSEVFQLE